MTNAHTSRKQTMLVANSMLSVKIIEDDFCNVNYYHLLCKAFIYLLHVLDIDCGKETQLIT